MPVHKCSPARSQTHILPGRHQLHTCTRPYTHTHTTCPHAHTHTQGRVCLEVGVCTPKQTHAQTNACTAAYVCAQTAHARICFGQALATSSRSRSVVVSYCCCCRAARRALTSATSSSGESSSVAEGAARHPGLATQIDSQNGIQDAGQHKNHPKTKMEENANGGTTSCRRGGHPDVIYSDVVFYGHYFFQVPFFLVGIFQKVVGNAFNSASPWNIV